MLIGTSLGKCVKSILDGDVKEEDVLFIVANTMAPDLNRLMGVIEQYYYGAAGNQDYDMSEHTLEEAKELAQRLFESGKLHQPRCIMERNYGRAHDLTDSWYEIVPKPVTGNESVIAAYEQYRLVAELAK